jgi:hypothetical protein
MSNDLARLVRFLKVFDLLFSQFDVDSSWTTMSDKPSLEATGHTNDIMQVIQASSTDDRCSHTYSAGS